MNRLKAMLYKEFIQLRRDVIMLRLLIMLPIVQIIIFGLAIDTDVKHIPTVVFDQCRQEESRELLDIFVATNYYDIKYRANSMAEVNDKINSGQAVVGIIFPPDMVRDIKHGELAQIQLIVDASDNMAATSAISTAQLAIQQKLQQFQLEKISNKENIVSGVYDLRIRPWYNPDFISAYYIIPGIIGIVLTMTLVMAASISIVRERRRGYFRTAFNNTATPFRINNW